MLILDAICDDYENVDQTILRHVAEGGLTVARHEVVEELTRTVEDGLATAHLLSSTEPCCTELEGMPRIDEVEETPATYFYITDKGRGLLLPRQRQLCAIEEAAGCWEDEDHPELADGSDAWVRQMRDQSEIRCHRLEEQRES
jgi:hypothetical protein